MRAVCVAGTLLVASFLLPRTTGAGLSPPYERLDTAQKFQWQGIDFSVAQFVDPTGFSEPDRIFPHYLHKWNTLFVDEGYVAQLTNKLQLDARYSFKKAEVLLERPLPSYGVNDGVTEAGITPISQVRAGLELEDIETAIRPYCAVGQFAIGIVVVVDQLNHQEKRGVFHWVFFDIARCTVLDAPRFSEESGGYGFRNRWMRPFKDSVPKLRGLRRQWKEFAKSNSEGRGQHADWILRSL